MSLFKKSKHHVLVVDDDQHILDVACDLLQEAGFETASAITATQARQEMEKHPMDIMLLDIKLPDEDGLKFLIDVKKRYPRVPVVILTGAGYDENLMQTALKNGASDYISKENDMETMADALKNLLK